MSLIDCNPSRDCAKFRIQKKRYLTKEEIKEMMNKGIPITEDNSEINIGFDKDLYNNCVEEKRKECVTGGRRCRKSKRKKLLRRKRRTNTKRKRR
jgi:hypothetical protein